jgi:hypothetical protein
MGLDLILGVSTWPWCYADSLRPAAALRFRRGQGLRLLTARTGEQFLLRPLVDFETKAAAYPPSAEPYDPGLVRKPYSAEPPFHPSRFPRLGGREPPQTHPLFRMDPLIVDCPNPATPANLPSHRP